MTDTLTIERAHRCTLRATKHSDGCVIVRAGRSIIQFDAADLQQLYAYAANKPTIQRYPAMASESRS